MIRKRPVSAGLCSFGPFEFDLSSGELRKYGVRLHLQEQPARILAALLERAGEVVTREELRDLLWASDTFVDFERSLNAAVAKLRQALADSAEEPRYVETVARHGYRFAAPLTRTSTAHKDRQAQAGGNPGRQAGLSIGRIILALGATAALLIIVASAGGYLLLRGHGPSMESGIVRFAVAPPEGIKLAGSVGHQMIGFLDLGPDAGVSLSPDGRALVFAGADAPAQSALWVRFLDSETSRRLETTDGASYPFWSPDSRNIGFFANGKLKRISARGGSAQILCNAADPGGGAWSRDDTILFSSNELYRVPATGGTARQVTQIDQAQGEIFHALPQFLPDSRNFIFWAAVFKKGHYPADESAVFAASLDSPARKPLLVNRTGARLTTTGHLVFLRGGIIFSQKLDVEHWRPLGEPRPIEETAGAVRGHIVSFSVSDPGVLSYRVVTPRGPSRLAWYSRDGRRLAAAGEPGPYLQMFLSPDERKAALTVQVANTPGHYNIWVLDLETNVQSHITFGDRDSDPVWSPDSQSIMYNAVEQNGAGKDLMWLTLGDRSPRLVYSDGRTNKSEAWSPDGKLLLFRRDEVTAMTLAAHEQAKPAVLLDTPFIKGRFSFSPDGRRLAYVEGDSRLFSREAAGPWESSRIHIADFPSMTKTRQVSTGFGCTPLWRRDAKELYYMGGHGEIMSVDISAGPTLEAGAPKILFRPPAGDVNYCYGRYGAGRDGQRFLVIESSSPVVSDQVHVVMHWDAWRH